MVHLKEFFPGLVTFNGRTEPPWTWKHYVAASDTLDQDGVECANCLGRVEETFWVCFFIYQPLSLFYKSSLTEIFSYA
jgi:hypothetical protein